MELDKLQLQRALEIVKPGLASKEQLPQSTSFAFIDGMVRTYNDDISIAHPLPGLNLEGAILAENLYKFLGKITTEKIELTLKGNEIVLTSEKAKAGLLLQSTITLPFRKELAGKRIFKRLPENFADDIAFVMTACTRDTSRPILTCVHVNKMGFVEGSDGLKLARYELKQEMPVDTFLLPATSAIEMVRMKPNRIAEGRGWAHFKNEEGTVLSCRIFENREDKYPSTHGFYEYEGVRVVLPSTTDEVLARAMVFSKRDHILDESVHIEILKNKFTMTARSDTGWFEESAEIKYTGEPIKLDVTPSLVKGILAQTREFMWKRERLHFRGDRWYFVAQLRI